VTATQQVADWLEKLGMSEYVQRFTENRIDFSVLPDPLQLRLLPVRRFWTRAPPSHGYVL
jgi:hypothetical protein